MGKQVTMHQLTEKDITSLNKSGFDTTNLIVGEHPMWCGGYDRPCGALIESSTSCPITATSLVHCKSCEAGGLS